MRRSLSLAGRLVAQALAASLAATAPAFADTAWRIDPGHTAIGFSVDGVGSSKTEGRFTRFDGRIAIDLDRPERSRVAFHVDAASVDMGAGSFSDYLRSAAFLDVARHPTIDFVSSAVERLNERTVRVSGALTLLGVTKPLSVDVEVTRLAGGLRYSFAAKADIDRLAFGMNSGFPVVSRVVVFQIASEASAL